MRKNEAHESVRDADARSWMKSSTTEEKLSYQGQRLIVNARVAKGQGQAKRDAAVKMAWEIAGGWKRVTVMTDRAMTRGSLSSGGRS